MKKLIFLIVFLFSFVFTGSDFAQTKFLSGRWGASVETPEYTLDKNSGQRSVIISVNFSEPFNEKPEVILGMIALDAFTEENIRYKVETESVSRDGMTIKITTWGETQIYGISGYWLAFVE